MAADFQIFGMGFVLMIICIAIGILMSFAGGTVIDILTTGTGGKALLNNSMVSSDFQASQQSTMWFFVNLYYFLCYAVPVLGIVIFIQSILPRTSGDRYV